MTRTAPTELDIRARLVEALQADLVGPFVPDGHPAGQEVLPIAPSRWYLTGFLAPEGGRQPETDDDDSTGELGAGDDKQADDSATADPEPKRPVRFPASMGLSVFLPPGGGDTLEVEVSYADYDKVQVPIDRDDNLRTGWKRVPHGPVRVTVPLDADKLARGLRVPGSRGLELSGELRTTSMKGLEGTRVLSLFLVNRRDVHEQDKDTQFVFQVKLALSFAAGFRSRPNRRGEDATDDDQRVLALMFRDKLEWAVGHNTSLVRPSHADGAVTRLGTTQLPTSRSPRRDTARSTT